MGRLALGPAPLIGMRYFTAILVIGAALAFLSLFSLVPTVQRTAGALAAEVRVGTEGSFIGETHLGEPHGVDSVSDLESLFDRRAAYVGVRRAFLNENNAISRIEIRVGSGYEQGRLKNCMLSEDRIGNLYRELTEAVKKRFKGCPMVRFSGSDELGYGREGSTIKSINSSMIEVALYHNNDNLCVVLSLMDSAEAGRIEKVRRTNWMTFREEPY